jgi:hypothetical protein
MVRVVLRMSMTTMVTMAISDDGGCYGDGGDGDGIGDGDDGDGDCGGDEDEDAGE